MSTTTSTKTKNKSFEIVADEFYLVEQQVEQETDQPVQVKTCPIDHVVWIDCSGSMSGELPLIRQHLKNKLPSLVAEADTVSLGWFSSRGEFGFLQERIQIKSLTDLTPLNTAIDRWLRPVCLTGFLEPLTETLKKFEHEPDRALNFFFLSDGYDNQWSTDKILAECEKIGQIAANCTVVEYGYYCNHALMTQMAEKLNGQLIQADDFVNYTPMLEAVLQNRNITSKKIDVELAHLPLEKYVFTIGEEGVVSYGADSKNISLPENTQVIYYFSEDRTSKKTTNKLDFLAKKLARAVDLDQDQTRRARAFAGGLYTLAQRNKSDLVYKLLGVLGDVELVKEYANAFGKQKRNAVEQLFADTATGKRQPFRYGRDPEVVPSEDAYCLLDFFEDIMNDDQARWYPSHPEFRYKRTSAMQVSNAENLTKAEKEQLDKLTEQLASTRDVARIREISAQIELLSEKQDLKFTKTPDQAVPFINLVWNENRPNLSVLTGFKGTVEFKENPHNLPNPFPTSVYRNYTPIRDGVLNFELLPMTASKQTLEKISKHVQVDPNSDQVQVVDLSVLPIINRNMTKGIKAADLFELEWSLLNKQALVKVIKDRTKDQKKTSTGWVETYGQQATDWLKVQGLTEFNGFSPSRKTEKTGDSYVTIQLLVKIAGASSLPSIAAVQKKLNENKKLNLADQLMANAIDTVDRLEVQGADLVKTRETLIKETRALQTKLAKLKFSIVLGQVWFEEATDNDLSFSTTKVLDGKTVEFHVELKDVPIEI